MALRISSKPLDVFEVPQPLHLKHSSAGRSIVCRDYLTPSRVMVAHRGGEGHPSHRDCLYSYLQESLWQMRAAQCPDCDALIDMKSFSKTISKLELGKAFAINSLLCASVVSPLFATGIIARYSAPLAVVSTLALLAGIKEAMKPALKIDPEEMQDRLEAVQEIGFDLAVLEQEDIPVIGAEEAPLEEDDEQAEEMVNDHLNEMEEQLNDLLIIREPEGLFAECLSEVKSYQDKINNIKPEINLTAIGIGVLSAFALHSPAIGCAIGGIVAVGQLLRKYKRLSTNL